MSRKGVAPVERQNSPAVRSVNPLRVGIGRPIGGAREGLLKVGAWGAAAHAEGEHESGAGKRVAAELMLRMGRQAWLAHLADLGMFAEALGQDGGVVLGTLQAQRQRVQAAQA